MSSEDRVRLNGTEVLLTEKQSNAGQCVHVMFLWKLTRTCPSGPVDWPHDSVLRLCSGTGLRVQSPSGLYLMSFICRTKFFSPVSSTLGSFPTWNPSSGFRTYTCRPCLYMSTTRSLSRPVHTCSSDSLHHFQLVQLLLRSSPLQENMIIELLALSHISCGTCSDKWVGLFLELKQPQEIVRVRLVHSNRNTWEHSDKGRSHNTYLHDHHGYFKLC